MLVLSRRCDEEICIGDDIVVAIVRILGNKVCVGIDAPANVPVHRREVYAAIQRDKAKRPAPDTADLLNLLKSFRLAGASTLYDVNEGRRCDPVPVDGLIELIERLRGQVGNLQLLYREARRNALGRDVINQWSNGVCDDQSMKLVDDANAETERRLKRAEGPGN